MAIAVGSKVTYNDPVNGSVVADVLGNSAGVLNLLVYLPNGTIAHRTNVAAGGGAPTAGQYNSVAFPTVQAS